MPTREEIVFVMSVAVVAVTACAACAHVGRQRLDLRSLQGADRIEVRSATDKPVASITDPAKIQKAIEFIERRQDRWGDRTSPTVPTYQLRFFHGDKYLGGYGVTDDTVVAFPTHQGWWWRDVTPAEISALLKQLGVGNHR